MVSLLLTGCAAAPARNGAALPLDARATPDRYVVVTVRNDAQMAVTGVASTPRGYGSSLQSYSAGSRARSQAHALATRYGLEEVAAWPIRLLGVHCLVYRIAAQSDREGLLLLLRRDSRVESAQPLTTFSTRASAYNDTYADLQRNLDQLSVPQAQQGSRGAGVRLAVVDTGVDTGHTDLKGRVSETQNFVDSDAVHFRRDRHGTAVAGVIAAIANNHQGIAGIAPDVHLLAYKACWETAADAAAAVCNTFTLAQALAAAVEARADIVNLSLGGPADPLLTRIVEGGQHAGIIFVGAAAPGGHGGGFPVAIPGVIGVEASETRGRAADLLAAPGEDIFTLSPADHYDAASGSSLATAEVSAVIALIHARHARITAAQARELLARTSKPVMLTSGSSMSVDACAAVAAYAPELVCGPLRTAERAVH